MKINGDFVITVLLVVCAAITTGLVVRHEFFSPAAQSAIPSAEQRPVLIPDWRESLERGVRIGPAQAPVQLIEFADFECPYCGDLHGRLKSLREQYPTQVALTYIHFPIPGHRFAVPAARVAECAGEQGRFEAMYDQLFEGQESFGLKPWRDYATAAGVADLAAFDACVKKTDSIPRVLEGQALGKKLNVQGTPTVIVNGWKLGRPPTEQQLEAMVKAVLAGKSPVS